MNTRMLQLLHTPLRSLIVLLSLTITCIRATRIELPCAIGSCATGIDGKHFFVGARAAGNENMAITVLRDSGQIHGITPEKTIVDGMPDCQSPLFNAQITHLAVLHSNSNVVATTAEQPTKLFCIMDHKNRFDIVSLERIHDSNGSPISTIENIFTAGNTHIFAPVKDEAQKLHLAVMHLSTRTLENKSMQQFLEQIDQTVIENEKIEETTNDNQVNPEKNKDNKKEAQSPAKAISLPLDAPYLAINDALTSIEEITDICWNDKLAYGYVGFKATAGSSESAGAYNIALLRPADYQSSPYRFIMSPIAENILAKDTQKSIIGIMQPLGNTKAHHIGIMHTSTGLEYLILASGQEESTRCIYALPVMSNTAQLQDVGCLANPHGGILDMTLKRNHHYTGRRSFAKKATSIDEIYSPCDTKARVGISETSGDICAMHISGDTVFAHINDQMGSKVVCSQALFDAQGIIIGWKAWQTVYETNEGLIAFWHNKANGALFKLCNTSDEKSKRAHYSVSSWPEAINDQLSEPFKTLHTYFSPKGGISAIIDSSQHHPALPEKSALIALGVDSFAVMTTKAQKEISPVPYISNDGSIPAFTQADSCIFTKEACVQLGHLTSACFAADSNESPEKSLLFIAGSKGLAYASICGAADQSLITTDASAQQLSILGNYTRIKKVCADHGYLYVMTDQQIDRIDLSTLDRGQQHITTIAQKTKSNLGIFFDMLVSEKIALLATSTGLYRIGNGKDVRTICSMQEADWQQVYLPEAILPIIKIMAHSSSGLESDCSRFNGGNVYTLGSYRGKNKSHLHRLAIQSTEGQATVHDDTIQLMREEISWGEKISLASIHTYKECFATDGASYFSYPGIDGQIPGIMCGLRVHEQKQLGLQQADKISCILHESSSGRWLATGSFGLVIHE